MKSTTLPEQVAELGRGWEWWPSLVWQFIWTWIVSDAHLKRRYTVLILHRSHLFSFIKLGVFVILWAGALRPLVAACRGEHQHSLL